MWRRVVWWKYNVSAVFGADENEGSRSFQTGTHTASYPSDRTLLEASLICPASLWSRCECGIWSSASFYLYTQGYRYGVGNWATAHRSVRSRHAFWIQLENRSDRRPCDVSSSGSTVAKRAVVSVTVTSVQFVLKLFLETHFMSQK